MSSFLEKPEPVEGFEVVDGTGKVIYPNPQGNPQGRPRRKPKSDPYITTVSMPRAIHTALEVKARRLGMPVSRVITQLVIAWLKKEIDPPMAKKPTPGKSDVPLPPLAKIDALLSRLGSVDQGWDFEEGGTDATAWGEEG